MSQNIKIWNSSIRILSNHEIECSNVVAQPFQNLPDELLFLRSTCYFEISKRTTEDTGKLKLNVLFDGLRLYERMCVSYLHNLLVPNAWGYYQHFFNFSSIISFSEYSLHLFSLFISLLLLLLFYLLSFP